MISEEKMVHIVHLVLDGLYHADMVDYPDEDEALKEGKRVCLQYLTHLNEASDVARKRIRTQKNAPMENSPQWEVLFHKYLEEETKKRGG